MNQTLNNVVITDTLKTPGTFYKKDSIQIYKGTWAFIQGDWRLTDRQEVTQNYTVNIDEANNSFTVDLGNMSENDNFMIIYKTTVSYVLTDGELFENNATLTANDHRTTETRTSYHYLEAGGSAEGYVYTIGVYKIAEAENAPIPLEGAVFDVIRKANGQKVGTLTTDIDGNASIGNLLKQIISLEKSLHLQVMSF